MSQALQESGVQFQQELNSKLTADFQKIPGSCARTLRGPQLRAVPPCRGCLCQKLQFAKSLVTETCHLKRSEGFGDPSRYVHYMQLFLIEMMPSGNYRRENYNNVTHQFFTTHSDVEAIIVHCIDPKSLTYKVTLAFLSHCENYPKPIN